MNIKLMKHLCQMTQTGLRKTLVTFLKNKYEYVYENDDFIVADGSLPVVLIAHMDTVFMAPPEEIFYDEKQKVMWSPNGLGADDRAGVYSIIQIINKGYRPSIIFTTDEEIGCVGASILVKRFKKAPFLKKLKYIIQLDRRGKKDCVFYDCDNRDFIKYVEKYGFYESWGSFSDISVIAPIWGVAAVNLSIGYEDEHSPIERLYIKDMENTIKKVIKMLDDIEEAPHFKYVARKKIYDFNNNNKCTWCGEPIRTKANKIYFGQHMDTLCDFCFKEYLTWDVSGSLYPQDE